MFVKREDGSLAYHCQRCDGSKKCAGCNGRGRVDDGKGRDSHFWPACRKCEGSGKCPTCDGVGSLGMW